MSYVTLRCGFSDDTRTSSSTTCVHRYRESLWTAFLYNRVTVRYYPYEIVRRLRLDSFHSGFISALVDLSTGHTNRSPLGEVSLLILSRIKSDRSSAPKINLIKLPSRACPRPAYNSFFALWFQIPMDWDHHWRWCRCL
jgi:hypothetical protein